MCVMLILRSTMVASHFTIPRLKPKKKNSIRFRFCTPSDKARSLVCANNVGTDCTDNVVSLLNISDLFLIASHNISVHGKPTLDRKGGDIKKL